MRPEGRLRLGTALSEMSRKIGLNNADVEALEHGRARFPLSRCTSNDLARYQCGLRGDEARTASIGP